MNRLPLVPVLLALCLLPAAARPDPIVANHACCDLSQIPHSAIEQAKATLRIAYGHTSHGSQVTDGMSGLATFSGAPNPPENYAWNEDGSGGALALDDYFVDGDLGNPDFTTWASRTRSYLNAPAHSGVNVVMWSWCGQLSWASEEDVDTYLSLMTALESDYPGVTFVYMTGHLDGTGAAGTLDANNDRIRAHCLANDRVLFDFADIESYDPDGNEYMTRNADDGCNWSDGGGSGNWAVEWQNAHVEGTDWYSCGAAHTEPLNANRKAYAAWWLFARLAGWEPGPGSGVDFTASPTQGGFPLAVQFTDASTCAPTAWDWDFGDGAGSTDQNPLHAYVNSGTYSVTLTVTAADGGHSRTRSVVLGDGFPVKSRPSGKILVAPKTVSAGVPAEFSASCRSASAWRWTFPGGDPPEAVGPGPHAVTFAAPGKAAVTLDLGNARHPWAKVVRKSVRVR